MKLRDRVRAALALDGEADPQARDEKYDPWGTTIDVDREEPDRGEIDDWTSEYEENPLIRVPTQTFTSDILEPGVRVDLGIGEDDDMPTVSGYYDEDYNGLDLDDALEKWLTEAGIVDGEFDHDIRDVLEKSLKDLVGRRGTAMVEVVYDDREEQNRIMGLRPFKVETTTAYTRDGKNILLKPDDDPDEHETVAIQEINGDQFRDHAPRTPADKTAAWVQFDEQSILGRRLGTFKDRTSIPLSQNDVMKQTLDLDIGGDDDEDGVFGTSILRAVKDDAEEYRSIKRDQATAVKGKAWGLWTIQFKPEVIETDTHTEIIRWDDEDISNMESQAKDLGPGSVLTSDALMDLKRHDGDVPDLDDTLNHYVNDILAPLPAPKYAVGFETDINQFVTEQQENRYEQVINEERDYQERSWTAVFREVARRHPDLNPEGLDVVIEPEQDESPVLSLDMETIEKIQALSAALSDLVGQGESPAAVFGPDVIRELVAHLPEDTEMQETLARAAEADVDELDEDDPNVQAQFERLVSNGR